MIYTALVFLNHFDIDLYCCVVYNSIVIGNIEKNFNHFPSIHNVNITHTHAVPPSPPLNVRVVSTSSTTLTLAWEEPVSTGGRGRDELRYNLWIRAAEENDIRLSNTVTSTIGVIGGKQLRTIVMHIMHLGVGMLNNNNYLTLYIL